MTEQFVRVCRVHGRVLEGLTCPVGPHHVERWRVVDRAKDLAVSEAEEEKGEVAMLRERLTPAPPRPARRASKERQEAMDEREKTGPVKAAGDVKQASFVGPAGQLVIRLLRRKNGVFQVGWALKPTAGKKAAGLLHKGEDRSQAYDAWGRSLEGAKAEGWQERTAYTPIPSANSVARGQRVVLRGRPAKGSRRAQPARGVRTCSKCGEPGHQKRTCGRQSSYKAAGKRGAKAA